MGVRKKIRAPDAAVAKTRARHTARPRLSLDANARLAGRRAGNVQGLVEETEMTVRKNNFVGADVRRLITNKKLVRDSLRRLLHF